MLLLTRFRRTATASGDQVFREICMPTGLRVLMLEDQPSDSELILLELGQAGFTLDWHQTVDNQADFAAALNQELDVILSDYNVPGFDGLRALRLLQQQELDVPFILVTGALGDELAAECIKRGASDYVLKDRLLRLGPAIERALEGTRLRQREKELQRELEERNIELEERIRDITVLNQELENASRLRRYLSPQLAESIIQGETDLDLGSRRRELTIFFSDIRGFTAMSERVEPEELINNLNIYLSAMTDIVFKYEGTLDKYIGDAIMVFFGDPVPHEDHAERAVKMALEMRERLHELQKNWSLESEEALTIGMGISTGHVTVGNIGSNARMDYTVLGNYVNLASRLADDARPGEILITARTLARTRDLVTATEHGEMELKGVSRPVKIYSV